MQQTNFLKSKLGKTVLIIALILLIIIILLVKYNPFEKKPTQSELWVVNGTDVSVIQPTQSELWVVNGTDVSVIQPNKEGTNWFLWTTIILSIGIFIVFIYYNYIKKGYGRAHVDIVKAKEHFKEWLWEQGYLKGYKIKNKLVTSFENYRPGSQKPFMIGLNHFLAYKFRLRNNNTYLDGIHLTFIPLQTLSDVKNENFHLHDFCESFDYDINQLKFPQKPTGTFEDKLLDAMLQKEIDPAIIQQYQNKIMQSNLPNMQGLGKAQELGHIEEVETEGD